MSCQNLGMMPEDTKKGFLKSKEKEPTRDSSTNQEYTAFSAFLQPKKTDAYIPRL